MALKKQGKETEKNKLKQRIIRDVVFVMLGLIFLVISIIMAYNGK